MDADDGRGALGTRLRELRTDAGLSLSGAAARSGVGRGYISDIEAGRRLPSLPALARLAAAYGKVVAEVLDGVPPYGRSD